MTASPMKKTVLIADHADARLSAVLSGHELVHVRTLDEAKVALSGRNFDLAVISLNFDESRMFELLRYLRSQERHRSTPVVCALTADFPRHPVTTEALEIAVKALGGTAWLDLKVTGDTEARRAMEEFLAEKSG